jgi:NTP pyrophosphatase (non-canonical NTP hydrolase)
MSVQELQREIAEWIDPLNPDRTSLSTIAKILEELGELIASERMNDPLELADVAILVLDLFYLQQVDLSEAVRAKLAINKSRNWQIADSGAMRHA